MGKEILHIHDYNNNMILTTAEIHTLENHFVSFARKEDSWKSFSFPVNNLCHR